MALGSLGAALDPPPSLCTHPFANEEHWLVHEVVLEPGTPGHFAPARVEIAAGGARLALPLPRAHPFDPAVFEPLVAEWIRALGLTPQARAGTGPALPLLLTDFRAEVLDDVNRRVSSRLSDAMLDPQVHEEAALVVGAFGLREEAGRFQDLRGWIEKGRNVAEIASWTRIALDAPRSVEDGHRVFPAFLEREVTELDAIHRREYSSELDKHPLARALNQPPRTYGVRSGV